MIKAIVRKIIPERYIKQFMNFKILASNYGQYESIKQSACIDNEGNKIPWYTYPAIEYLNNINFKDKRILEFGSGNSSEYWAVRSLDVISVEHDKEWYQKVKEDITSNQRLLLKKDDETYERLDGLGSNVKFDVIIIDAIRRFECAKIVENYLNKEAEDGYMVILDNSDWYKNSAEYLRRELDLIEIDFHGFGPINNYTWTTSVFFSRNFKFKPINNLQPVFSNAAIIQSAD
ncbi:MAG: hypothetical protein P8N23_08815 [Methylophilaceae bacterium]|nr:hypothetical protein [Methylophilaceae bacterium]